MEFDPLPLHKNSVGVPDERSTMLLYMPEDIVFQALSYYTPVRESEFDNNNSTILDVISQKYERITHMLHY